MTTNAFLFYVRSVLIVLTPVAESFSQRLGFILDGLCGAAAHRAAKDRAVAAPLLLLWSYLRRLAARFDRLLAGGGRPRAPRLSRGPSRSGTPRLPGRFAWLAVLGHDMAVYGCQLQYLLDDPDVARLLAQTPRAARMLRPLRRMLGHPAPPTPPTKPRVSKSGPPEPPLIAASSTCSLDPPPWLFPASA